MGDSVLLFLGLPHVWPAVESHPLLWGGPSFLNPRRLILLGNAVTDPSRGTSISWLIPEPILTVKINHDKPKFDPLALQASSVQDFLYSIGVGRGRDSL